MFFAFEKISRNENEPVMYYNLIDCDDVNLSGHPRIHPSPVVFSLLHKSKTGQLKDLHNEQMVPLRSPPLDMPYIIAFGVAHSPEDWCGPDKFNNGYNKKYPNRKNLFEYINEEYLLDLQKGKAYLLIDQTHEGYHKDWLFQWFHNSLDTYSIPANKVIYITGDIKASKSYKDWADNFELISRLNIIGWPHFETVIYDISSGYHGFNERFKYVNDDILPPGLSKRRHFSKLLDQIKYKKENIENIKTFDILQKRPRLHRIWFYKYLVDNDLVNDNIISMNIFDIQDANLDDLLFDRMEEDEYNNLMQGLPKLPYNNPKNYEAENFISSDGANYVLYLNDETMLNSWCSVISEVFYYDEDPCFISEKTFKPIACSQPFIVLSTRGFLSNLRDLGYKTFHPYIDEEYDSLPEAIRMRAIICELSRIHKMTKNQKLEWYLKMSDILQHNFEVFNKRQERDNVVNIIELLLGITE